MNNSPLTLREEEIMTLLKEGYCYKEIAPQLGISHATVKMEMRLCIARLGAKNALHAVVIAIRNRYLSIENTGL